MSLQIGNVPRETDVLVIGSGFGGSVAAETLAAAGVEVCLVERGKSYPPGSFPRTPAGVSSNFWDPGNGLHGMFNVWTFEGLEGVVSSGLGGGSLIYANVMLPKDPAWFTQPHPYQPGVTEDWSFQYDDLEPHYDAVSRFLDVQSLPRGGGPQFDLPKTAAFQHAARGMAGSKTEYAPLAVRFRNAQGEPAIGAELPDAGYPNLFGQPRRTCRMLGECDIGCNEGAKNSLDHTYLSAASAHGASLHERTEVLTITRRADDGRFDVVVRVHDHDGDTRDTADLPRYTITAKRVVMSAGTFGSTYLMLRNRDGLGLDNPALGTRFCGNGDLLGFIFNARESLDGTNGPVITSYARFADRVDTGSPEDFGMYIEDAGYPAFAAWLVETSQIAAEAERLAKVFADRTWRRWFGRRRTSLAEDIHSILGPGNLTAKSLPILGMGRDVPDGTLYLRDGDAPEDTLDSTWNTRTSMNYFDSMTKRMERLSALLGGKFVVNPTYALKRRVITVHPLGGCPADTSVSKGVVDSFGRVHGVPGLRVCDGSVFPGPVGANPSLTIAAFARRAAMHLIDEIHSSSPDHIAAGGS